MAFLLGNLKKKKNEAPHENNRPAEGEKTLRGLEKQGNHWKSSWNPTENPSAFKAEKAGPTASAVAVPRSPSDSLLRATCPAKAAT